MTPIEEAIKYLRAFNLDASAVILEDTFLDKEKQAFIDFHVEVMEKGLEAEASEYKKTEWERLVRHQATKHYNVKFNK